MERDPAMNPNGFWEDLKAINGDLREVDPSACVKVFAPALANYVTLDSAVDKVIWCQRSHAVAARKHADWNIGGATVDRTARRLRILSAKLQIQFNPGYKFANVPLLIVKLDELRDPRKTKKVITQIRDFINSPVTDLQPAVDNVQA